MSRRRNVDLGNGFSSIPAVLMDVHVSSEHTIRSEGDAMAPAVSILRSERDARADADDVKIGKVIARAWTDPEFKNRLRTDLPGALLEMDIDPPQGVMLRLAESDDKVAYFVLPPGPEDTTDTEDLEKRAMSYDYRALVHVLYNVCCC
jgi:hypothetical protein